MLPAGKYRCTQPYLLQPVNQKYLPSRLSGGDAMLHDVWGPTFKFVDFQSAWPWDRDGGDWLDANLVRYGTTPWFSAPVVGSGSTLVKPYTVDVTDAVSHCHSANRWCAFLLVANNAPRALASAFHPDQPAPAIDVVYSNGQQARLNCRVLASNTASSSGPITTNAEVSLPAFIEFDRPAAAVASATLAFVVTQHWSGRNPTVDGYLLDPPVNTDPIAPGVAAAAGVLDQGIEIQPGVIGAHRYLDGRAWEDFVLPGALNIADEMRYDPAVYDAGPTDLTLLPHRGLGKWINTSSDWSLVSSSYRGDGFKPLAPGLGAMRIQMPAEPGVMDGSVVGSSGTLAGNAMIFLPEHLFGRLGRIFIRYYFRLGTPLNVSKAARKHVQHQPGQAVWTTMGGKFGIGPDHSTSWGGVSGSSGGPYGWQMRSSWMECDAEMGGPSEGGWTVGHHLFDYYYQNPPAHNYGRGSGAQFERWGQRGGTGGVLYADNWYCVETELKLNTISDSTPGYLEDGELRTWIDGRLAFDRTGMVFRTGPVAQLPRTAYKMRPCRELGVRGLWLNWFHGGKTLATIDRTSFYTGLAYGTQYIGPMRMS